MDTGTGGMGGGRGSRAQEQAGGLFRESRGGGGGVQNISLFNRSWSSAQGRWHRWDGGREGEKHM